jgi:hypothetical protein
MFDTLKYTKKLESVGVGRQQAETTVGILAEVMDKKFATKQDLKELENKMDYRFELLENRLTIKMGAMIMGSFAFFTAVVTAIQKFL